MSFWQWQDSVKIYKNSDQPGADEPGARHLVAGADEPGADELGARHLDAGRRVEARFIGKRADAWSASREESSRGSNLAAALPASLELAWVDQVHSAAIVVAEAEGCRGRADALITRRSGLALAVVTADCVPVLLASLDGHRPEIGAVHAGWRGVAAEIVPRAVERFAHVPTVAWIGPAIGVEAYEVSHEVADALVAVSAPEVKVAGLRGRPHVDLQRAVEVQLQQLGIVDIRRLGVCTHANPDVLWSYRRDGASGSVGRNIAAIWITDVRQPARSSSSSV